MLNSLRLIIIKQNKEFNLYYFLMYNETLHNENWPK